MDTPLKLCNSSRVSQPCCCIRLRRYRLQGGSYTGETCKDRHSSVCKGILLYAPAIGACGLRVWKVAQLVEQEAIPSPRFDSWLSDFTRIIVTKLTAVNAFSTRHPRGCLFILSKYKNSTTKKVPEKSGVFSWKGVLRNGENDRKTKEILRRISH